ncbi:hypothetical protein [Methylocystis parvus]|uniref:Uncharacterized protein n=1 Tax=Methylocystis parvus TaxID=134 RepID=A0A6B8M646_9HYPH|nr:hypothetical protein [Methylocystis parvus]QGM97938.1 hypothetical protein F7D14_10950 [Methylocystis parvus]WBK01750.1 hypothetical protein MMG94_08625 [Methylocystis parvus OBBP]
MIYDDGLLRIHGFDRANVAVVEIRFNDALLIRITDEGARLKLWRDLGTMRALILIDQQSDLLNWLFQENFQSRDLGLAKHYIISVGEEVFDIVSISEPYVSEPSKNTVK